MKDMNTTLIVIAIIGYILSVYIGLYIYLLRKVDREEQKIVSLFLEKTSKIPAIIEVMRPTVVDVSAFQAITELHSEAMIRRYRALHDLLEHNMRIEHEFSFLMKLSMQIPKLQKDKYFVYMRDFIITYERDMKKNFIHVNSAITRWNRFIAIKNVTIIGMILP
jgi:hypothetical protein